MSKRVLTLAFLVLATNVFAGDRFVVHFDGGIPASFPAAAAASGATVEWQHDGAGLAVVSGLTDAGAFAADSGATQVVPDVRYQVRLGTPTVEDDFAPELQSTLVPSTAFYFPRQWHLRAIGAQHAWAAGRLGSPDVTVAVIDTGVSYQHPDLAGLVDLSRSVSFAPEDDPVVAFMFPGAHPVSDLHYHGTHVASTISSNAVRGAGVTSRTTIIGIKVINRFGEGTLDRVLAGVLWAADHGADVANISLGGQFTKGQAEESVAMIQKAFNYAHRKGVLVIVAAGNEEMDLDHDRNNFQMFCSTANVVCVSATGPTASAHPTAGPWTNVDAFAAYSNYGRSAIHVAAPGGTGPGLVWAACSKTSLNFSSCRTRDVVLGTGGTSMAAPHVSGLAALLVEDIGHGKPAQVKARLQQTADDLGPRGTDPYYGKGRINVARALGLQ